MQYSENEQKMLDIWLQHMSAEFERFDADETMQTMTENPHNIHVPTLAGGASRNEVREFYANTFVKQIPQAKVTLVSRTIGQNRIVDEMIFEFTHSSQIDWMLPGIPATGKEVRLPIVVIVEFSGDKVASEHIYWDQASLLSQVGLLDAQKLPVVGAEQALKLKDPDSVPSNLLMRKNK